MRPNFVGLTGNQLSLVLCAAQPLAPDERSRFLKRVVANLRGRPIDDGAVRQATADAQAEFCHD